MELRYELPLLEQRLVLAVRPGLLRPGGLVGVQESAVIMKLDTECLVKAVCWFLCLALIGLMVCVALRCYYYGPVLVVLPE